MGYCLESNQQASDISNISSLQNQKFADSCADSIGSTAQLISFTDTYIAMVAQEKIEITFS